MISPRKAPMLCWHRWPVTLQTLKDAQENNSREITGAATDRVAMNYCEHNHPRAGDICINITSETSPSPYTFGVLHSDKDVDQVDLWSRHFFSFSDSLNAGLALIKEHSTLNPIPILLLLLLFLMCHHLGWVATKLSPVQHEMSLSPHQSPAWHFLHTLQRCRLPYTCTHTCTHVAAAHFI